MQDLMILGIIAVLVIIGLSSMLKRFKGKSSCCGGGNTYISKKKLNNVIAKKTFFVEGMTCENCVARVTRVINDIDGLSAKVNLKKKEVEVSMEKEVGDAVIKEIIEKAGYEVVGMK